MGDIMVDGKGVRRMVVGSMFVDKCFGFNVVGLFLVEVMKVIESILGLRVLFRLKHKLIICA